MQCKLTCLARGFAMSMLAAGLVLGGSKLAMAGFFDACLAPGDQTIQVHQNTVVRRERVLLPSVDFEGCFVEVDPGVTLTLNQVRIDVVGDERLAFEGGGPTATIMIRNSFIRACDTDIFGFGDLTILRSNILDPNTTCDVKEFFADGDIAISSSVLSTENPEADSDIVIDSSDGKVAIVRSELRAADDLRIEGPAGVTLTLNRLRANSNFTATSAAQLEATRNIVSAPDGIALSGDPCILVQNVPSLSCAAPPP